jgi:crotonobetainyl-CoA:carnitine CoA-transferase CaiB-like acyl-CoA transferase
VRSRFELLQDPQVRASQILEEHESPWFGRVRQPRPAARFDRTPARIRTLAPLLGEHTASILGELGYTAADLERLQRDGIVRTQPAH